VQDLQGVDVDVDDDPVDRPGVAVVGRLGAEEGDAALDPTARLEVRR
jgi:hypothetical protein